MGKPREPTCSASLTSQREAVLLDGHLSLIQPQSYCSLKTLPHPQSPSCRTRTQGVDVDQLVIASEFEWPWGRYCLSLTLQAVGHASMSKSLHSSWLFSSLRPN